MRVDLPYIVTSKKAQVTAAGVLLTLLSDYFGMDLDPEMKAQIVAALIAVYTYAQGQADRGRERG